MRRAYRSGDATESAITLSFVDVFSCSLGAGLFVFLLFVVMPQGLGSLFVPDAATDGVPEATARVEPPVLLRFEGVDGTINIRTVSRRVEDLRPPHVVVLPADEVRQGVTMQMTAGLSAEAVSAVFSPVFTGGTGDNPFDPRASLERITFERATGSAVAPPERYLSTGFGYLLAEPSIDSTSPFSSAAFPIALSPTNRSVSIGGNAVVFTIGSPGRSCTLAAGDLWRLWPSSGGATDVVYVRLAREPVSGAVVGYMPEGTAVNGGMACDERRIRVQDGWVPMNAVLAFGGEVAVVVSVSHVESRVRVDLVPTSPVEQMRLGAPVHQWVLGPSQQRAALDFWLAYHVSDQGEWIAVAEAQCSLESACDGAHVVLLQRAAGSDEFVAVHDSRLSFGDGERLSSLMHIALADADTLRLIGWSAESGSRVLEAKLRQPALSTLIAGQTSRFVLQPVRPEPGAGDRRSSALPWLVFTSDSSWVVP